MAGPPTDGQLKALLVRAVAERPEGGRVVGLWRRPSAYRSSLPVDDVGLLLDDGREIGLVLKDLSAAGASAKPARPDFTFDPRRSIRLHRDVLDSAVWGTPEHWASVEDKVKGRYWLVLERVNGVPLDEAPYWMWLEAAGWMGRFHRHMGERLSALVDVPLACYDAQSYRIWMARARSFADRNGVSPKRVERLATAHEVVLERLLALPVTVIHGDFHASNVLVAGVPGAVRVSVLDWEMAGVGPGMLDLAALTAGDWSDEQRSRLVSTYIAAVHDDAGDGHFSPSDVTEALEACRFQHAIQWLGWDFDWRPPADQARDWLGEAELALQRLGV